MNKAQKRRFTSAEARAALLDAGSKILHTRGLATGLERVSLKEVVELSGVPRGSAFRLFDGPLGPSNTFRIALLVHLDASIDLTPTTKAVTRVLEEHAEAIATGDPITLAVVLREVIRVGLATNVETVAASTPWRIHMSSLAAAGDKADLKDPVSAIHRQATAEAGVRAAHLYGQLAELFGLRPKHPHTWKELAAIVNPIVEGTALRQPFDDRLTTIDRATGVDKRQQTWNAAAIAFESLLLTWTEPDPNAEHSADISAWLQTS